MDSVVSLFRNTAILSIVSLIIAVPGILHLYANELAGNGGSTDMLSPLAIEDAREFTYPAGYMDRSPKQHRVMVKEFCIDCDLNLTDAEAFKSRASVVNQFKLSSHDAIGLDIEDNGRTPVLHNKISGEKSK